MTQNFKTLCIFSLFVSSATITPTLSNPVEVVVSPISGDIKVKKINEKLPFLL